MAYNVKLLGGLILFALYITAASSTLIEISKLSEMNLVFVSSVRFAAAEPEQSHARIMSTTM